MESIFDARTDTTCGSLSEQELVHCLHDVIKLFSKVYVVLDGLDEVAIEVQEDLLRRLDLFEVNLLITSRPLEILSNMIPNALRIHIQARNEDIDVYVKNKVAGSARLRTITRRDPHLISKLSSRIQERSQGM